MNNFNITVLIYINEGMEKEFIEYESEVLPLIQKHNGILLKRIKPVKEDIINESPLLTPFEIHLISFNSQADLVSYKNDPERIKLKPLGDKAIKKSEIFELLI